MDIIWSIVAVSFAAAFLVSFIAVILGRFKSIDVWYVRFWGPLPFSAIGLYLLGHSWLLVGIGSLAAAFVTNFLLLIVDRLSTVVVRR